MSCKQNMCDLPKLTFKFGFYHLSKSEVHAKVCISTSNIYMDVLQEYKLISIFDRIHILIETGRMFIECRCIWWLFNLDSCNVNECRSGTCHESYEKVELSI